MEKILKQSSWLLLAQGIGRVVGFFYTIFLARNLGVEDFGLYSVALAYFSLVSSIADFGFNRFLIREVARDHQKIPQLLSNISIFRLALTAILFAIFSLGLYLIDPDKLRVNIILLGVLAVLPQSISFTIDAIFVATQKLQLSSIALVILNLATTLFGVNLINNGFGVMGSVVALILGQLVYLIFLSLTFKTQKLKMLSVVKWVTIRHALLGSLPYGILGILGLLYFRIDLIILTYLRGSFDSGIYGAAYKFLEAVVFIPSALSAALFPVLAKLHDNSSKDISKLYFSSMKLMFWISILITVGYVLILPLVIRELLPNYLASIEVIKVLALTIPFIFIHVPGAQVLLSTDKYLKPVVFLSVITLSVNILLNLTFIPKYGFMAAAWITVFSEALSFVAFYSLLRIRVFK